MIQVYLSKYLSLILSFLILSISLWVISLPVLMLLNYLLIYLTKYEKLISYSLAHQINIIIFLLPIIFTIVTTLKIFDLTRRTLIFILQFNLLLTSFTIFTILLLVESL